MILETQQGLIEFTIPKHFNNIGYKVSGGADSAIVGWLLCKTIVEECNSDPVVYPITMDQPGKAYQVKFAKGVVAFLKQQWPTVTFGEHFTGVGSEPITEVNPHMGDEGKANPNYNEDQSVITEKLFDDYKIRCLFNGVTANPSEFVGQDEKHQQVSMPPERNKTGKPLPIQYHRDLEGHRHPGEVFSPLVNIDKKGVAEIYNYFGLIDTLFPLTRSCEDWTEDFSAHCGKCWFCLERLWGFGKL